MDLIPFPLGIGGFSREPIPCAVRQFRLTVEPRGKGLYEFTRDVSAWLRAIQAKNGLLTVFIQHTSASLLIQENADPDVVHDLEQAFRRLAPEDSRLYRHTLEGPDDMPAHIRAALTQTSISIPVSAGHMAMGAWQGLYVFEHRSAPHRRNVMLLFLGEVDTEPSSLSFDLDKE